MAIQPLEYFTHTKKTFFYKICRINLEWTKYRGVISWSGYMYYSLSEYISHHLKRYRTTCRLKALDAYLNKKIYYG